jgi:hypothetical protein
MQSNECTTEILVSSRVYLVLNLGPKVQPIQVPLTFCFLLLHVSGPIYKNNLLMEQQFVISRTVCQTEICTLLNSWVINTPSKKMLCLIKNSLSLYFHNTITCLSVGVLKIGQVYSVTCKFLYRWVTRNCCCF